MVAVLSTLLVLVGTTLASAATPTTMAGETFVSPFDSFSASGT